MNSHVPHISQQFFITYQGIVLSYQGIVLSYKGIVLSYKGIVLSYKGIVLHFVWWVWITLLCVPDPDIPEIYSAYDDPPHCYLPCHLNVSTINSTTSPREDEEVNCDRHEILKEQLAVYYNMSQRKSSAGVIRHYFNGSFSSVVMLSAALLSLSLQTVMLAFS